MKVREVNNNMGMALTNSKATLLFRFFSLNLVILPLIFSCKSHGLTIELIRIDSIPDSPFFPPNLTQHQRHHKLADLSLSRASAHQPDALRPPVLRVLSSFYVTRVGFGRGGYYPYVLVDTGGDDVWVQTDGCTRCFLVRDGNFQPHHSPTFRPLPCEHRLCRPRTCENGTCTFSLNYVGSAQVRGRLGLDTLAFPTFNSGRGPPYAEVRDVAFGCATDSMNVTFGENTGRNNIVAGVFGLGAGRRSILSQLGTQANGVFAYCLPHWTSPLLTSTVLRFGADARLDVEARRRAQTVRMVPSSGHDVRLVDISVNNRRLRLGMGMAQVDSGSPYSVLGGVAYEAVKGEVVAYFDREWGLRPMRRADHNLCYDRAFSVVRNESFPTVTFHFETASFVVQPKNLFVELPVGFCMAMVSLDHGGPTLIGAYQQANHRFVFDISASTISFLPEVCDNN